MIKTIRKRDGQLAEFDKKKISEAIFAAMQATRAVSYTHLTLPTILLV